MASIDIIHYCPPSKKFLNEPLSVHLLLTPVSAFIINPYRTGALSVGDSILAINGDSLASATLPQAVYMLSTVGDTVQLKIRKATSRSRRGRGNPPVKVGVVTVQ